MLQYFEVYQTIVHFGVISTPIFACTCEPTHNVTTYLSPSCGVAAFATHIHTNALNYCAPVTLDYCDLRTRDDCVGYFKLNISSQFTSCAPNHRFATARAAEARSFE
eukprot:TRINITY_DN8597_c1_g2_i1.p1 TRINITY_DN8597_c1_g2~~TRINITY_DN8597_c1_g2_i1.p1  ORF type:complete len:107 (-),score=0.26 TRINITY_DN8597_c1_g2_i1:887-1207(-)